MKQIYVVVTPILLLGSIYAFAATKRKRNMTDYSLEDLPTPQSNRIPNLDMLIDQL